VKSRSGNIGEPLIPRPLPFGDSTGTLPRPVKLEPFDAMTPPEKKRLIWILILIFFFFANLILVTLLLYSDLLKKK
jgi:hypothetical protein